ncbi:MAG: hypothetical protein C5B50_18600 [Verrucomicrobia bacterium]|nr:MAG: hypothetical protein C5B50_18600 [Verrucomicrobiota bacterium]
MKFAPGILLLTLTFFARTTVQGQSISTSKLSAHLINGYSAGCSNIIAGHPRVLKVLGLDSGFPTAMVQTMRDYKAQVPLGKLVVRIYTTRSYTLTNDPTASALDFWTNAVQQGLNYLSPSDRALIDYLEGPNEGNNTPTLGYPNNTPQQALQSSQWFNQFWTNLTPKILAAGYKPCLASIAVGNPGGSTSDVQSYLAAFVPALRQANAAGGVWSYHSYTINYTTDTATEFWYSLRYRQFYSYFASAYPDLTNMPMILTEGGVDENGTPTTSGWQYRGTADEYQRWLNWFDSQMQQDSYLLGCTIFEIGNPESWGWPSFDLEPIAGWMKNYLITPGAPPPVPSGIVAVPANGSVTLSWTNPPLNPTTWSVKRATNSSGPYFTIATGQNSGVPATAFTDTSVNNSTPYYYVVTGVNSFGESDQSPPVSVVPAAPFPGAINCGGPSIGSFMTDAYYSAGSTYSTGSAVATNGLINPAPAAVYQSQRYGNLTYSLPYLTPRASYKVRLHFAEIYWTSAGQRVFNVLLNGVQVLTNYDIVQAAGGSFKGNVQEFNAISDSTGTITVQLVTVVDNASINGIEIIANPTNTIPTAPANLAAAIGNALVTLTWSTPAGATNFSVKRGTNSSGPFSIIGNSPSAPMYRDPFFTPNTTYYYVVSALNGLGESANSSVASARPTNGLPDVIVTSVSWTPPTLFNGSQAVFSARVLNQGSAATPSGIVLGVGFNMDSAGTVSWSATDTASLAPGASITLAADGGPSGNYWTATPGPHNLIATVNDVNRFAESITDNNSMTVPILVSVAGYAINCGGAAAGSFAADSNYAGSANTFSITNTIDTTGTSSPAPMAVYQTERWGEVAYVLNNLVPGSNYTVRLHFAEISPSVTHTGDRQFNVSLNGLQIFSNFDILSAAGAKFRAISRDIKKQADASGTILVQFTRGAANEPKCSGIEAFGSASVSQPPVITGLGLTNSIATVTWQTSPATIYQVQYKDDSRGTNWMAIGNAVVASGTSLSITNPVSGLGRRFYRIAQFN